LRVKEEKLLPTIILRMLSEMLTPRVLIAIVAAISLGMAIRFVYGRGYEAGYTVATNIDRKALDTVSHNLGREVANNRRLVAASVAYQKQLHDEMSTTMDKINTRLGVADERYDTYMGKVTRLTNDIEFKCNPPPKLLRALRRANSVLRPRGTHGAGSYSDTNASAASVSSPAP